MKRIYTIILFLTVFAVSTTLLAQEDTFMQRITLEAGGGYNLPVSPTRTNSSMSDYAGFRSFYLGANYAISELAGVRLSYGNNSFEDTNNSSLGVTLHKFMAEGTFNILQAIEKQQTPFEIMAHAGAGFSFGKNEQSSDTDKMVTAQIGLMPKYRITSNFSVLLDAAYVINLKQNFYFDGGTMPEGGDKGGFFMVNLGVAYSF